MRQKSFSAVILVLFALCLCACGKDLSQDLSQDSSWASLTVPEILNGSVRMVNLPERQQQRYSSADGLTYIVLDIQIENHDQMDDVQTQEIKVGRKRGIAYIYHGEAITYTALDAASESALITMAENDYVIEWEQEGLFYRLFGTLSPEEMLAAAGSVETVEK